MMPMGAAAWPGGFVPCRCCAPRRASSRSKQAAAKRGSSASKKKAQPSPRSPRRIDVHNHITPPCLVKALGDEVIFNGSPGSRIATYEWNPGMALEAMDRGGTATAITSTYASSKIANHPEARRIARECNEFAARMAADHPGRFGHFATLPMPDVEGTLKEIEYALDELKLCGVEFATSYGRQWLGDEAFWPVLEELNRRKAVVYTHPREPEFAEHLIPGVPGSTIEFCVDTARTIASLLFSGAAVRFPAVRFIFSHGGGVAPFIAERYTRLAGRRQFASAFPKGCLFELKKFHYEVAQAAHPGALSALTRLIPLKQILFGTDFPYRTAQEIGQGLVRFGFDERALHAINRGNAVKLFPRFA